jgi:hypothetical protein
LTDRGWVTDFEIGFSRTFHQEKDHRDLLGARRVRHAAEAKDTTVEDVTFSPAGSWAAPIPLTDVPPRVFSETMRDLDLVVSVAYSGGVDPETTESSIDMRRRLIEETADLLALGNIDLTGHHELPLESWRVLYAAAGWSTAIFSYSIGGINAAEL